MKSAIALAAAALIAAGCAPGEAETSAAAEQAAEQVVILETDLAALRADFNAARDDVRLVFLVGPSCSGCLRGLADMETVLSDQIRDTERLTAFVVFVPTLSAQEHHARQATQFLYGDGVRHYWDPSGASGDRFQEALGIDEYAWDIWMTYPPGVEWTADTPPAPESWMHQLWNQPRDNFFDADAFAEHVGALVERLG